MSFGNVLLELAKGFGNTCLLFAVTLVCALPLGLLVSFGSMSRFMPLKAVTRAVVWVVLRHAAPCADHRHILYSRTVLRHAF